MTSGGARTQSGPRPQENSGRSDRRGYALTALPAEGYSGPVPDFPLPAPSKRELEVWAELWRLPQGCLWSRPGFQWLLFTIGLYVRQLVKCEDVGVGATHLAQLHRFADQVGMSASGLAMHGFKVADLAPVETPESGKVGALERARRRDRRLRPVTEGDAS